MQMSDDNIKKTWHPLIESLQEEVLAYYKGLRKNDESIRFQFLFSPFFENADILILGYNPGLGDKDCFDANERLKFEYLIHTSYPTARDTNYVFEKAGLADALKGKIVKSNIFYLATENADILYGVARKLKETPNYLFYQKQFRWTRELVQKCAPKLIILEGTMAYQEFKKAVEENGFGTVRNLESLAGNFWGDLEIGEKCTPFIGFHRTPSGMKNRDGFVSLLATTCQQVL